MSKHTKGPWIVEPGVHGARIHTADGEDMVAEGICNASDARLVAAAPELLEALRRIAYEPFGPSDATHEQVLDAITELARAAIAKATGR